jgi:hypothetical protein
VLRKSLESGLRDSLIGLSLRFDEDENPADAGRIAAQLCTPVNFLALSCLPGASKTKRRKSGGDLFGVISTRFRLRDGNRCRPGLFDR